MNSTRCDESPEILPFMSDKGRKPRKFTFPINDSVALDLSRVLRIDVVKLSEGNPRHAVDVGTGSQNLLFISEIGAITAWNKLRRHYIYVYAREPDYINTDAGSNFKSEEF